MYELKNRLKEFCISLNKVSQNQSACLKQFFPKKQRKMSKPLTQRQKSSKLAVTSWHRTFLAEFFSFLIIVHLKATKIFINWYDGMCFLSFFKLLKEVAFFLCQERFHHHTHLIRNRLRIFFRDINQFFPGLIKLNFSRLLGRFARDKNFGSFWLKH